MPRLQGGLSRPRRAGAADRRGEPLPRDAPGRREPRDDLPGTAPQRHHAADLLQRPVVRTRSVTVRTPTCKRGFPLVTVVTNRPLTNVTADRYRALTTIR